MDNKPKLLPHIVAVLVFIILPVIYFLPMLEGKKLQQTDYIHYKGMAKEIVDFREETGEETLWTNSMFSGMPAYLISMKQPGNVLRIVHKFVNSQNFRPACHVFLYMLGFYILLLLFGVDPWLGILGGIAYGFSSYFFIILAPGHLTKAMALGYMPMIIGSVYYSFRKNAILGAALTGLFLGFQLIANHLQITYYTMLILMIFGIFEIVRVAKNGEWADFLKTLGLLAIAVIMALMVNIVNIWTVKDYSSYSLRSATELSSKSEDRTSGLDKSYATGWSYGIDESLNLLIPSFKGGSSSAFLADRDSETFKYLTKTQGPQGAVNFINQYPFFFTSYWGTQPGTSGPVYIGAVVLFLFLFGMFFTKGNTRWWLLAVVVFSLLLAWGKNFMFLTDLFLDYFPGYNKFRTVSMILVMAQLAIPLLGILALSKLIKGDYKKQDFLSSLKNSLYILGGISLLFVLAPSLSNLSSPRDEILVSNGLGDVVSALMKDRAELLRKDAFRSLVFILLTAGVLYLIYLKKLSYPLLISALGLLILVDLWPVNKRYINDDNFVPGRQIEQAFQPNAADLEILKDKELYFRVFDKIPSDPFASSRSSYFHNEIGGYHGAKMRRYQELYDHYIKAGDSKVLDMLNTKYLIEREEGNRIGLSKRETKLGNAWFVGKLDIVEDADAEIEAIGNFDPATEAVIDKRFSDKVRPENLSSDSTSQIVLENYAPNKLVYSYKTKTEQIAVFSEIYYPLGWNASLNGEKAEHFRLNYVLRGMQVPAGEGEIVFEFHPPAYYTGNKIAFASSILMVVFLVFGFYSFKKKNRKIDEKVRFRND